MLNNKSNFNKNTDLLLFLSSRSENISLIKKNYNKKIILIDRFTDSTIAYQHYGMGVNLKLINVLNKYLLKNIKISFTFLNIVNNKNLFLRLKKRKILNRYDKFNSFFYNKVQNGFIKLAKRNLRVNAFRIKCSKDKECFNFEPSPTDIPLSLLLLMRQFSISTWDSIKSTPSLPESIMFKFLKFMFDDTSISMASLWALAIFNSSKFKFFE